MMGHLGNVDQRGEYALC